MKIAKFSFLKKQNLEKVKTLFDAKFHSEKESVIFFSLLKNWIFNCQKTCFSQIALLRTVYSMRLYGRKWLFSKKDLVYPSKTLLRLPGT